MLLFQKDLRPHLSFSYRFRPSALQRRIRFENAFIPSVRMLKRTRRMRISMYRPAKLAQNEATWWRLSAILDTHGQVVWRPVVSILMTSPFSDNIVFSVHTGKLNSVFKKHRFQIAPHWRAFSNGSVFDDRFRRCSVDDSRIRNKRAPFSFENGLVWTGPYSARILFKLFDDFKKLSGLAINHS